MVLSQLELELLLACQLESECLTLSSVENVGPARSGSVLTGLDTEVPEDPETGGQDWSLGASSENESQTRDEALGRGAVMTNLLLQLVH